MEILYTSLLLQAAQGLARSRPAPGQNVKGFRRTWLLGFAAAIRERLTAAEAAAQAEAEEATQNGTGKELAVVLDARKNLASQAARSAYPKVRAAKSRVSGTGLQAGYGAGLKANLGTESSDLSSHANRAALT